jgi:putative hemolysin
MTALARAAGPVVSALELTSNLVMKLFRLPQGRDASVTEADVSAMLAAGTATGVFDPVERWIVERVFRLDDEPVAAMMTPRRDIVWLDVNDSPDSHDALIRRHPYSRYPVCDGDLDRILGILAIRDLWVAQRETPAPAAIDLRSLLRPPLFVPDRSPALAVLQQFQRSGTQVAVIVDEHGGVDGLLTLNNILTFLVSPPAGRSRGEDAAVVQRTPGSWLVDGALSLGDFYAAMGMEDPGGEAPRSYHTVAGLVLAKLERIPAVADRFELGSLTIEVADMDGSRVDKVLVTRRPAPGDATR